MLKYMYFDSQIKLLLLLFLLLLLLLLLLLAMTVHPVQVLVHILLWVSGKLRPKT